MADLNGTGNGGIWSLLQPTNSQIIAIDVIIGIAVILLLIILLYVYVESYREFRSKFTLGLVFFALLLLFQNLLFTSLLLTNSSFMNMGMAVPFFFLNLMEFFALLILIWITLE
jgi:hypothetical protein